MSDCDTVRRYRRYRSLTPVRTVSYVAKRPSLAPGHTRTNSAILAALNTEVSDYVTRKNVTPPQCHPCEYVGEIKVFDDTAYIHVRTIWEESFQLRDADGNVIHGTAKYMAGGDAQINVKEYERRCMERVGADPSEFEKAADSTEPEIILIPDAKSLWDSLPDSVKSDLQYEQGGKKPAKGRKK